MADDIEYAIISDPEVGGFYTGPDGCREDDFLSEDICKAAKVVRLTELREIKRLRRGLENKLRGRNIAKANYDRGMEILDAQQDALERADQPQTALRMPAPLDPYHSAMMVTAEKPILTAAQIRSRARWPNPTPRQVARAAGLTYYQGVKRCRRGHDSLRAVINGGCLACTDIWEIENREKVRAIWRESKRRMRAARKLV